MSKKFEKKKNYIYNFYLHNAELELDRLMRSHFFNKFGHHHNQMEIFNATKSEAHILHGIGDCDNVVFERSKSRFLAKSPLGKENLTFDHNYRMLAIGQVDLPPRDERLRVLEAAYLLPEEQLSQYGICIGILGRERSDFDTMLKLRRKKKQEDSVSEEQIEFEFQLPPRVHYSDVILPTEYPHEPPQISKAPERQKVIHDQCRLWKLRACGTAHFDLFMQDFNAQSSISSSFSTYAENMI